MRIVKTGVRIFGPIVGDVNVIESICFFGRKDGTHIAEWLLQDVCWSFHSALRVDEMLGKWKAALC